MTKTALITGATSGIGQATAKKLLDSGWQIVACGRRKERLEELMAFGGDRVIPLAFDVRKQQEVVDAIAGLPKKAMPIDLLINNAGNAFGREPLQDGSPQDWDKTLDTNVKGLLYVTHAVLPLMEGSQQKQILNVGSIAGKESYPKGNVYCASKAAVDSLTKSMRLDLLPLGFNVGQIAPGAVETEFSLVRFKGDEEQAAKTYQGYQPLTPDDIAEAIEFMANRPYHVSIADLVIYPRAQANAVTVDKG